MTKILIIEDDTNINNMVAEALKKAGYECVQAFSGTEGLRVVSGEDKSFSVIVMDLMLPGMNGEELLPLLKEAVPEVPVIVISAKDALDSKVNLLSAGAEDYLTKPFEIDELIARVGVQIRRAGKSSSAMSYGALSLTPETYDVSVSGNALNLTRQEYKIMELLITHPKRAFTKQEIYDYAWDDVYIGEDKTINVHVSNIRKKIKAYTDTDYIETVWGIGFKLAEI